MQPDVEGALYDLGIEVLKETEDELWARCPMHLVRTGKEDSHPSWSINTNTYVSYCFSCGYGASLNGLYRDLTGEVPPELEWTLKKAAVLSALTEQKPQEPDGPDVNEWVLENTFAPLPEGLRNLRHLTRQAVDDFGIRWDKTKRLWVIPIRDADGLLVGYQFRRKGLVRNHPPGMKKAAVLFGLHLLRDESAVMVVESPLDAVRLCGIGVPSVATFGAGISKDQLTLLSRNFQIIVSGMDNDKAGQQANQVLHTLSKQGCVVLPFSYKTLGKAKDPGDVEDDDLLREAFWQAMRMHL